MKPFAEGKEEEEDGKVGHNKNTVDLVSHLELGKAVEEIGGHVVSFVRSGIWL
jgi:hypothetical protein